MDCAENATASWQVRRAVPSAPLLLLEKGSGSVLSHALSRLQIGAPARWGQRAFTLIELLVVMAVISLLAALLLPALGRAKESGRATACLSNLHQIGIALQLYVQDNNNRLPYMNDKSLTTTNPYLPPSVVLSNYLGNVNVLRCPSDKQQVFENTGSSYAWNSLLNGEDADHLTALGIKFDPHQIPLMFDKDKFHAARGPKKALNFLYADGHIKNLLEMAGTIQQRQ
ncbi:MAG TPA: type II secretion system protein [Candidatus Acidoferrum sp.]|jgi:prepilin-type N-terminal cleavage/methylation domain-containing protein/prepilin-type processing-associated H-X9-DG protein|nr:type II secretion system protein [Candidatus Acidoferrum sp.]